MSYRVVFMGTPEIADGVLEKLLTIPEIEVVAVVSQPDKPVGRKQILTPPPTKIRALDNNIQIFQPNKIRKNTQFFEDIEALKADFFVVIAYGKILPAKLLEIPKYFPINIHASILPKYRGASPIQECLKNRDLKTGVSLMRMDEGMDTGDIISIHEIEINLEDNYQTLEKKLISLSNMAIESFFDDFKNGKIEFTPQNHSDATYTKIIVKNDGLISFNSSISEIIGKVKGFSLWPKAFFFYDNMQYLIINANPVIENHSKECGLVEITKNEMRIYAKDGYILVTEIQPQAKNSMDIKSFYNGIGKNLHNKVIL